VVQKQKESYRFWLSLHRNFPRTERFGIGRKIDAAFLETLELTFSAAYLQPEQKIIMLGRAISRFDIVKYFMQLAWESKLLPTDKYVLMSEQLEEIGRQLGAWRRGLQTILPPK
jgi:hypothetical protein